MGMGHGWYCFLIPDGREVLQYFPQARRTAYTEYGVSGVANLDVLQQILPPEEQYPPKPGTAWELRHGFRAWDGSVYSWLELPTLKHYFHINSIEELVTAGQFLQAEGLRFIYEECRRQKPYCAMSLSWCFNEPWPTAANNNLLCWPTSPKPALEKVAQACRPVLASAKAGKISWQPGETFSADLWLLNDLPEALPAGRMNALLRVNNREIPLLTWDFSAAEANTNLSGPTARCILPEGNFERFELHLRVEGHPEWDSVYPFLRNMISEA
jgi:beta-mannosidase